MTNSYPEPPIAPAPTWPKYKMQKQRAQVKSRFYYLFWGAATVSVLAGQLYVGSGYRQMARSFNRIMDAIVVEVERGLGSGPRFY
tara:strand:- start:68 stop:322 length:255 start_codon:yes stop_codon:yes gene_type:complete